MYELRYQLSITAPPDIVAQSDQTLRGMRDLRDKLNDGKTYASWKNSSKIVKPGSTLSTPCAAQ
ncbi:hypothetical protein [Kitasatospora cinereorecta]|uniref:Uncharacterized protein n=1 Tax=Kitasatospora cinereorecta TaxID=285560 RepID=A0ABW0VGY8_9ACTN